jgi:hypothetical protein
VIYGVGHVPLERPDGLPLGLLLGHLLLEVDPSFRVLLADLADGHHVDGVVELAVAPTTQPVNGVTTRRQLDRSDAGIGGEPIAVREASHVTRVADELAGQDGAHAIELGEGRPRCEDCRLRVHANLVRA